jgi:hypothetical protein
LFLVLIVVAAATTFSIFVATYQKQLQSEQSFSQERGLEKLQIIHLTPSACLANSTLCPGDWSHIEFTLASLYVGTSIITGISIDNNQVANYSVFGLNYTTNNVGQWNQTVGEDLYVAPHAQLDLNVSLIPEAGATGMYNGAEKLLQSAYISIDFLTTYDNSFAQTFIPPTAIAVVGQLESYNGTGYTAEPLLIGSNSIQGGANETIVAWDWNVTETPSGPSTLFYGEMVADSGVVATDQYNATLTVVDSDGLTSSDTVHFTAP